MKTPARPLFLAALASCWMLSAALWAQDSTPPAAADPNAAPVATPAAAPATSSADSPSAAPAKQTPPAATQAPAPAEPPAAEAKPEAAPPPASEPATPAPSELRRLDEPGAPATDHAAEDDDDEAKAADETAAAPAAQEPTDQSARHRRHGNRGDARVALWHDSTLLAGERADAVVSVFGSSTSSGDVSDAVVSVFGNTRVPAGEVGDAAVAIFGNNEINAKVHGDVVAVFGNVELGANAEVFGNVVCVFGSVKRAPGSVLHGELNNVVTGFDFGNFEWLHAWVNHCLVLGRPLAFAPHLMWAWWIALGALALYLLLAFLFPRAVVKCAETLEQRPGYSILTAFLVTLLTPAAAILLLITIVGTPALIVCLLAAALFGKAVMLAWLGRRITLRFGSGPLAHPAFAVLLGGIIVLLLYTVPFLGFVLSKLLSWIGLGVVVYTLIQSSKRSRPAAIPTAAVATAGVAAATSATAATEAGVGVGGLPADPSAAPVVASSTVPLPPPVISALALPRAGFWIRIAASFLDALIIGVAVHLLPHFARPNFLVVFAAYCAVFWGLRATTLGGIVCGLKVVRIDDRRVDWVTAVVRALGGFLSLVAVGIGFIWVAFDDQKQSWHDKIAGTTIVRVPRGVSLV